MSESNSIDVTKKLSPEIIEQAKQLIALVDDSVEKVEDSLKHLLEFMKTNKIPPQFMRELYVRHLRKKGLSEKTIKRRLPGELKDPERVALGVKMTPIDSTNVLEYRQPPKAINQPIEIPDRTIIPPARAQFTPVYYEEEVRTEPVQKSSIVKIIFDPAPIDRDRTQVFIIHYDLYTNKIKKYETVGRRTLGR